MNNKIYLLVLVIFIFGCATAPEIIIKPSKPGDSVALIYLSDSTPRHEHVGTTVFTNFTKKDVSKKSYEESISNGIEELIKSKSNFSVVRIKLEEIGIKENEKLYSAWTGKMLPKYKTSIERLSREKNFGYVVVINQSLHEAWANSSAHVEGFGLYSRCLLGFCTYEVLDQLSMSIYSVADHSVKRGFPYRAWNRPSLNDITKPAGVKNVEESYINLAADRAVDKFYRLSEEYMTDIGLLQNTNDQTEK